MPDTVPLCRSWPEVAKTVWLHAVSLQRLALLQVRSGFENSIDPRAHQAAEIDRLREENALLREELRIKDSRLGALPPRQRPHYPPAERLAILTLRAKTGWSAAQTARRFLLTRPTIQSWMHRLDEQGEAALVQLPAPVNRFPDFVTSLVQALHAAAPRMGRRKLAEVLARAGLHLAASTVERRLAALAGSGDEGDLVIRERDLLDRRSEVAVPHRPISV